MAILNARDWATTPLRKDAAAIINAGLKAIDIEQSVKRCVKRAGSTLTITEGTKNHVVDLKQYRRVVVAGFGKGSGAAVSLIADRLGNYCEQGIAIDVKGSWMPSRISKKVKIMMGTHPTSSVANVRATKTIVDLAASLQEDDLIIYFVGGGGSSLLCGSREEMRYATGVFKELTKKGATITELNVVRKHLSLVKGGGLARFSWPAKMISLVVSDVCGNDMATIASGPTVYDETTMEDALVVVKKYKIPLKDLEFNETPKERRYFKNSIAVMMVCNQDAVMAMIQEARKKGYSASVVSLAIQGEASTALVPLADAVMKKQMLCAAGETTVTIRGKGKGGRNQEAVLGVVCEAYNGDLSLADVAVISIASDGYDNTPVAGAIADGETMRALLKKVIDPNAYLNRNDSFGLFKKVGGHIITERRSLNVSDVMMVIRK